MRAGLDRDIAWSGEGRFESRMTLAPGRFAEVCGKLARADAVAWQLDASDPLNLGIHYQGRGAKEGQGARDPERRDALASASGPVRVALTLRICRGALDHRQGTTPVKA